MAYPLHAPLDLTRHNRKTPSSAPNQAIYGLTLVTCAGQSSAMRCVATGLLYVALFGLAACGKNVDDPTFNGEGQTAEGGTAASATAGSSSTSNGGADDDSAMDQGQDATTATPGGESTGSATTAPMDSGPVDDTGNGEEGGGGCGDGMVSPGEQCDGADLQGFDCNSLGLAGGTLSCDAVTCTFDTSMCMSGGGGTGGQ